MVFFNHATRQMTAKIVYYGPGLCGKTTNLSIIYERTQEKSRGEMVSLNTETDRTLFFDLLPMDVGVIGGFKAKLQLYTVPGQVFYNATRKLVLKGVDGIVFVADSQSASEDANRESLQNLGENLKELGLNLADIPMVFQWNKRDLKQIVATEVLDRELNPRHLSSFQAIARDGVGVFETLRGISRLALGQIKRMHLGERAAVPGAQAPAAVPGRAGGDGAPVADRTPLSSTLAGARPSAGAAPQPLSFLDLPARLELSDSAPAPSPLPPIARMPAPVPDAGPATLRVKLPADGAPGRMEVQVVVRREGRVVAEASAPLVTDVLTLEFKRS
jgi:GTPase SAR1 family protein